MLNMDIGNGVLIPKTQSMSQETKVPTTRASVLHLQKQFHSTSGEIAGKRASIIKQK